MACRSSSPRIDPSYIHLNISPFSFLLSHTNPRDPPSARKVILKPLHFPIPDTVTLHLLLVELSNLRSQKPCWGLAWSNQLVLIRAHAHAHAHVVSDCTMVSTICTNPIHCRWYRVAVGCVPKIQMEKPKETCNTSGLFVPYLLCGKLTSGIEELQSQDPQNSVLTCLTEMS